MKGYLASIVLLLIAAMVPASAQEAAPANVTGDSSVRLIVRIKPMVQANNRPATPQAEVDVATRTIPATNRQQARRIANNLISVTVDSAHITDLTTNPDIQGVYVDKLSKPFLQKSLPMVRVDVLQQNHITGAGYAVAILDTGVDGLHPALANRVIAEACYSSTIPSKNSTSLCPSGEPQQFGPGSGTPCSSTLEGCGHGTHVAGIAAAAGGTYQGKPIVGVAPGANIVAVQVFSRITDPLVCGAAISCIASWESDQIAALDYVLAIAAAKKIAAVNLSIGQGDSNGSPCDGDAMKGHIDDLRRAGVLTVISAGNSGFSDALSSPACISTAISVGATIGVDGIAISFSDRAPFMTIVAPGMGIMSTWPTALGGGYHQLDGTSMSAPFVAGTIALLRSAFPRATADNIAAALTQNAPIIDDPGGAHFAVLDAQNALSNLRRTSALVAQGSAPPTNNSAAPTNVAEPGTVVRVIATTPQGLDKPSDVLLPQDKTQIMEETKISDRQFSVTAPNDVIEKLRPSITVQPDRLSTPNM